MCIFFYLFIYTLSLDCKLYLRFLFCVDLTSLL